MKSGITEKRLADQRFKRTEEAILRVFFEAKEYISVRSLAIKIGVARSTIYYHHKNTRKILPDYKKYILKKYLIMVRRVTSKKGMGARALYINILLFILREKRLVKILIKNGESSILKEMILKIKPKIELEMNLPKNSGKIYEVFASELTTLLEWWGKRDFNDSEMNLVLSDMLILTETARTRLAKLLD